MKAKIKKKVKEGTLWGPWGKHTRWKIKTMHAARLYRQENPWREDSVWDLNESPLINNLHEKKNE